MEESLIPDALVLFYWYIRLCIGYLVSPMYVCLLTSIVFALKPINDVTLLMVGRFVLRMNQFLL